MTRQQAVGVGFSKLLMWHLCQPFAYMWVFVFFSCHLSTDRTNFPVSQQDLGQIVAAREVIYLTTIAVAAVSCPVYLLLDISTVWREADTRCVLRHFPIRAPLELLLTQSLRRAIAVFRIACYFLGPHNFVALTLAKRFQNAAAGGAVRYIFLGLAALQILADFASCFALAGLLDQAYGPGSQAGDDEVSLQGL